MILFYYEMTPAGKLNKPPCNYLQPIPSMYPRLTWHLRVVCLTSFEIVQYLLREPQSS